LRGHVRDHLLGRTAVGGSVALRDAVTRASFQSLLATLSGSIPAAFDIVRKTLGQHEIATVQPLASGAYFPISLTICANYALT
jgi:hypothetical protein